MEDFIIKHSPEYIFFLQHPEKHDHYLILQNTEKSFDNLYAQFNRFDKYENGPVTMPHNKVTLIEKVAVPDKSLFGLCYFICHELEEITYKEDERWPYGEWGWYVVNGDLDNAKWLQQYIQSTKAKKALMKTEPKMETQQISLF